MTTTSRAPGTDTAATPLPDPDPAPPPHRPVPRRRARRGLARIGLRTTLRATTSVAVAFLLLVIAVGVVVIAGHGTDRSVLVDRLDPALLASQQLAGTAMDQENDVRAYVLSARPEFLAPYAQARGERDRATATLRGLLADQPGVSQDLDVVEARMAAWRAAYADPAVAAIGVGRPPPAPEIGDTTFGAVREALTGQQQRLGTLRADARSDLAASSTMLAGFAGAAAMGLAVIVGLLLLWLRRAVIGPTTRLVDEVRGVVVDDLDRHVEVYGPREIAELAEDVDAMRRLIVTELAASESARQELDTRGRELSRSNSDLEQFAYVASHDLQEPLRKVASFCQLLQRRYSGELDERADQYIEFAVDGAKRMQVLINDLLSFSRVGRAATAERELVDCGGLVDQAARNLEVVAESGARITHDDLPRVLAEPTLLTSVFQNLLANSLKFRGERPPAIHVSAESGTGEHAGWWLLRVSDNGIGIDPEYAERIFVIFQRLHARTAYPGTGIGLAMGRKIVEHHGGTMWLAARGPDDGPGTTFALTLPVTEESTA